MISNLYHFLATSAAIKELEERYLQNDEVRFDQHKQASFTPSDNNEINPKDFPTDFDNTDIVHDTFDISTSDNKGDVAGELSGAEPNCTMDNTGTSSEQDRKLSDSVTLLALSESGSNTEQYSPSEIPLADVNSSVEEDSVDDQ